MKIFTIILIAFILVDCTSESNKAEKLINKTIEVSGGNKLDGKMIEFVFRGKEYGAKFNKGNYEYVRLFKDTTGLIRDVLNNEDFYREIDGKKTQIPGSLSKKYANSVNSVIYFALLPYGLNDGAVNKAYIGEVELDGMNYDKVKITFEKENGGKDYNDTFIYWINKTNHKIDYLAYEYHTDEGGLRFRKAYNERIVEGIRFVDYINYYPDTTVPLENIDKYFIQGKLQELSRIELDNIKVLTN